MCLFGRKLVGICKCRTSRQIVYLAVADIDIQHATSLYVSNSCVMLGLSTCPAADLTSMSKWLVHMMTLIYVTSAWFVGDLWTKPLSIRISVYSGC